MINFLREYYKENNAALWSESSARRPGSPLKAIYDLFPSGPAKGACKVAGLLNLTDASEHGYRGRSSLGAMGPLRAPLPSLQSPQEWACPLSGSAPGSPQASLRLRQRNDLGEESAGNHLGTYLTRILYHMAIFFGLLRLLWSLTRVPFPLPTPLPPSC